MNIIIKNLQKSYKDKMVLSIDSLELSGGKIMGIVGPNGAGKSTLINIISGLDKDFNGEVMYNNKPLDDDIYKKITLVFQKSYLFRRSVYENITYPLKIRGLSKSEIEKRADNIIDRLEIKELKNKKGHLLSGGESQKVSLARALVFEPELLLLDEPTASIDPDSIRIMEREILRYNKEKAGTVIIITHNMEQAKRICDEVLYLQQGRVEERNGFL